MRYVFHKIVFIRVIMKLIRYNEWYLLNYVTQIIISN